MPSKTYKYRVVVQNSLNQKVENQLEGQMTKTKTRVLKMIERTNRLVKDAPVLISSEPAIRSTFDDRTGKESSADLSRYISERKNR